MAGPVRITLRRRELLAGAGVTLAALLAPRLQGSADEPTRSAAFETVYKEIVGAREPEAALLTLELPEHAENGNIVPYTLAVESPMTEADHVHTIHLLSTANPQAKVATFRLTPRCGNATVTGRMRLAKTQDVIALAETSTGKLLTTSTRVEVEIGGCGN